MNRNALREDIHSSGLFALDTRQLVVFSPIRAWLLYNFSEFLMMFACSATGCIFFPHLSLRLFTMYKKFLENPVGK